MLSIDEFTHDRDEHVIEDFGGREFTIPGKVHYFWRGIEVSRELFQELLTEVVAEEDLE